MLKKVSEVILPDTRFSSIVVHDSDTGAMRTMDVSDHHSAINSIELIAGVSTTVRTVFERARNAFLYAWFVYDLTPLAEAQGYVALEMALRETLIGRANQPAPRGLSEQLEAAYSQGYFDDLAMPDDEVIVDRRAYFAQLSRIVRHSRNNLAHGSEYVNLPGVALESLRLCATLINHLYSRKARSVIVP